jgi:hypothetical protein
VARKTKEEYVQECREWLARHKAWLDQREKQFEDQYPMAHPDLNRQRLEDLDAWKFKIAVHEWELQRIIDSPDEEW